MKSRDVADDTVPCPPMPESGEFPVVQIEVDPSARRLAPRYVESVIEELRALLAGLQCPDHFGAATVHVAFGTEDDPTVAVLPHDCCPRLDELLAHALRGSPIFRLIVPKNGR